LRLPAFRFLLFVGDEQQRNHPTQSLIVMAAGATADVI
jgi:hypothetical protein